MRRLAHNVDQINLVLDANLVEHLAQVGCRCGVYQGRVALTPHGFNHAKRGQRVDKARRALSRCGALRQDQALPGLDASQLRVHGAAKHSHGFAQQGARSGR